MARRPRPRGSSAGGAQVGRHRRLLYPRLRPAGLVVVTAAAVSVAAALLPDRIRVVELRQPLREIEPARLVEERGVSPARPAHHDSGRRSLGETFLARSGPALAY